MAFECLRCGNCCKQYYITLLPAERDRVARALKQTVQQFTQKYTILHLQLFPLNSPEGNLKIPASKIPEKFLKKINSNSPYFLTLPHIALKRNSGICIFYDEKSKSCKIHNSKPEQCNIFPLLTTAENPDWKKLHPFCEGLKASNENFKPDKGEKHYKKISAYFDGISGKGFKEVWAHWPTEGILALKDKKIAKISEEDFFEIISRASHQ